MADVTSIMIFIFPKCMFMSRKKLKKQSNSKRMCLTLIRYLPKPTSTKDIERNVGHTEAMYTEVHTYMKAHALEQTVI
jgi:hypothetical protein